MGSVKVHPLMVSFPHLQSQVKIVVEVVIAINCPNVNSFTKQGLEALQYFNAKVHMNSIMQNEDCGPDTLGCYHERKPIQEGSSLGLRVQKYFRPPFRLALHQDCQV